MRWLVLGTVAASIACGQNPSPTQTSNGSTGQGIDETGTTSSGDPSTGTGTGSTEDDPSDGGDSSGDSSGSTSTTGSPSLCHAEPGPADGERFIVVAKPYDADGLQAPRYAVHALSQTGEIANASFEFDMGRAFAGRIAFTLDGQFGFTAQDDGTVGVFRLAEDGTPEVLESGFEGEFYAGRVEVAPSGHVFVVDQQTANNGGGITELSLDCDGNVAAQGVLVPGDRVYELAWASSATALVAANGLFGDISGDDAFVIDLLGDANVLGATDPFEDDEAIVSAVALASGGRVGLIADNAAFSSIPNRLAIVRLDGEQVTAVQQIGDLDDPFELVASPVDDTALMVSGFGDAVYVLDIDPAAADPVSIRGELQYQGNAPQLPANAVVITRGSQSGLVLLSENTGIRRIRFEGSGVVTDMGLYDLGGGLENIAGAIGVQP